MGNFFCIMGNLLLAASKNKRKYSFTEKNLQEQDDYAVVELT